MKFRIYFKNHGFDAQVVTHLENKFSKLDKTALGDKEVEVHFHMERHCVRAQLICQMFQKTLVFEGEGENFFEVCDMLASKMKRKLSKEKGRLKNHKRPDLTREAFLERQAFVEETKKTA